MECPGTKLYQGTWDSNSAVRLEVLINIFFSTGSNRYISRSKVTINIWI